MNHEGLYITMKVKQMNKMDLLDLRGFCFLKQFRRNFLTNIHLELGISPMFAAFLRL